MKELYPKQADTADKAVKILRAKRLVYMACQVRTGKTPMSMDVARQYGAKKVLFLTKKKAISSVRDDLKEFGFDKHFAIDIVNDESMHKITRANGFLVDYDVVIHDEHHRFKSYPKPTVKAELFKARFGHLPQIYLSGTPHPESYSEVFHQFWVSHRSPFGEENFYKWVHAGYVDKYQKKLGHGRVNMYDRANKIAIMKVISPYMVTLTQEELGYKTEIVETILHVDMKPNTYALADWLRRDLVIEGVHETILADTAVKLQQRLHQIYSGTIIFEIKAGAIKPSWKILDDSKAQFIRSRFLGKKKGIFYQFGAELEMLKQVFGSGITTDLDEFNRTDKDIALQIVSGREGLTLRAAEVLIYLNIDYSAVSYWQSRDRLTTKERSTNEIFWIFAKGGIEDSIYESVEGKKSYTTDVFEKTFLKQMKNKRTGGQP